MTDNNEQHSQDHDFGPGALLKRTREEQGLSLQEVSTRLKLTLPVLNKIESDNYEGDLPATFYRGYLKNYAELLDIDDVDIGANFQQFCQKHKLFSTPPPKLQGLELEKPITSSNWLFKVVTGLIILALIAAIYYVVVEKELWKQVIPSDEQTQQSSDESALVLEQTGSSEADSSEAGLPIGDQESANTELPNDAAEELSTTDSSELSDGDSSTESSGELSLSDQAAVNSEQPAAQQANAQSAELAAVGDLSLTFTADCWVRIEDAAGKVLALGIQSGGTSLQLSGQAPYSLTLGKASAVQLTYDGEAVDLSNYPDTRAAKLTVGD